jgi:hypothetical protein
MTKCSGGDGKGGMVEQQGANISVHGRAVGVWAGRACKFGSGRRGLRGAAPEGEGCASCGFGRRLFGDEDATLAKVGSAAKFGVRLGKGTLRARGCTESVA